MSLRVGVKIAIGKLETERVHVDSGADRVAELMAVPTHSVHDVKEDDVLGSDVLVVKGEAVIGKIRCQNLLQLQRR